MSLRLRFLRWMLGLDPVDYWRDRFREAEREIERAHDAERYANANLARTREVARTGTRDLEGARHEIHKLREQLVFEQTARGLYEQVLIEAAEQIGRNSEVAPKTLMGVLRTAFVEARATVESWREGAPPEAAMVTNLRATLANRLLPDPKPGQIPPGRLAGGPITSERNRTGKAGDSTSRPARGVPHIYEYPFTGVPGHCVVPWCGRPFDDPIHIQGGWSPAAKEEI